MYKKSLTELTDDEIRSTLYKCVAEEYKRYTTRPDNYCFDQEDYDTYLNSGDDWSNEVFKYGLSLLKEIAKAQLLKVEE